MITLIYTYTPWCIWMRIQGIDVYVYTLMYMNVYTYISWCIWIHECAYVYMIILMYTYIPWCIWMRIQGIDVYIYTLMYMNAYTYIHWCIWMRIHDYLGVYMNVWMHISMWIRTYVLTSQPERERAVKTRIMYTWVHGCTYVYIHTWMYMFIHECTSSDVTCSRNVSAPWRHALCIHKYMNVHMYT